MTTATTLPGRAELLRPRLAREHTAWRVEVAAALGPAQQVNAGPWARWNALRYLQGAFSARVTKERQLVQVMGAHMTAPDQDRLWALGELLELLPIHLGHLVGLCHRAREFSEVTARIATALDCWCQAVEETLGPMPVCGLPENMLTEFGVSRLESKTAGS
jgi:hypothetical protein